MILWYNVISILKLSILNVYKINEGKSFGLKTTVLFMRIAIVGSRNIVVEKIERYISNCDEVVSGGAKGVDSCAAMYAEENGIKLTVFLPRYERYGRAAPIIRNHEIVDYADKIIAFWDGRSKGTLSVIQYAQKVGKECEVVIVRNEKKRN